MNAQVERRLLHASRVGNKDEVMRLLVEDGVYINCKDDMGYTALMWAAYYNRVEIADILLYYVANLNIKGNGGHTPVHIAVAKGSVDCVSFLCKAGANLSLRSNTGYTALHEGCFNGKPECVRILLEYKVPLNIKSNEGFTPLHLAASKGYLEICKLLIESGAAIEFTDSAGRTPLHLAAACPHAKMVVDLLLAQGVNASKKCLKNKTALQHAIEHNCTVSIPVLQMAESGTLGPIRRVSMEVSGIYKLPDKEVNNSPPGYKSTTTSPTIILSPTLGPAPNYSDPETYSPFSPRYSSNNLNNNENNKKEWRDLEQELVRQTKLVEQLRSEKATIESSRVKGQLQLAQEMKKMEEKLKNTINDLESVRIEKKNIASDLEATRKKFDLLSQELRTATQRHTLLCTHVAEVEESRLCKVCFERPVSTVLSPCSHCCLCSDCTKAVQLKNKKCPICRTDIVGTTMCFFT